MRIYHKVEDVVCEVEEIYPNGIYMADTPRGLRQVLPEHATPIDETCFYIKTINGSLIKAEIRNEDGSFTNSSTGRLICKREEVLKIITKPRLPMTQPLPDDWAL